jgi:hypothetical protein
MMNYAHKRAVTLGLLLALIVCALRLWAGV